MTNKQQAQLESKLDELDMLRLYLEVRILQLNITDQALIISVEELKKEIKRYRTMVKS